MTLWLLPVILCAVKVNKTMTNILAIALFAALFVIRHVNCVKSDHESKIRTIDFVFPDQLEQSTKVNEFLRNPSLNGKVQVDAEGQNEKEESDVDKRDKIHQHTTRESQTDPKPTSQPIPLEFIQRLNNINDSDELISNFVEGDPHEATLLKSRFGEPEERNAASVPKAAGCLPEFRTVKIASSTDPSILYIPQCTRIEQCGGCCTHNLLACQPSETEIVNMQVIKTQYRGGKKLKFIGKEIVQVEKHIKCKCDCRIKAENCNAYQFYKASECRCVCKNSDEEKKCNKVSDIKLWDPELCACLCREQGQCSTGYVFDQTQCRCVAQPQYTRRSYPSRQGYTSGSFQDLPFYD